VQLDIFKNIPGLKADDLEEQAEERKPNPYPNGPVKYKTPTNGQVRRAAKRHKLAQERKHIFKLRKQHWALRVEAAHLVAFLAAAEKDGRQDAIDWIEERYESVEKAEARLRAIYGEED